MAGLLNVAFDPASVAAYNRFPQFGSLLGTEMSAELLEIGEVIAEAMTTNTWLVFAEPTGRLADSIEPYLASPLELIIAVNVPYAWRMEEGFHAADSLGRIYDEDGKPYALPALQDTQNQVAGMMNAAVGRAIAQLQGGTTP